MKSEVYTFLIDNRIPFGSIETISLQFYTASKTSQLWLKSLNATLAYGDSHCVNWELANWPSEAWIQS